jgi:hypothetical protein
MVVLEAEAVWLSKSAAVAQAVTAQYVSRVAAVGIREEAVRANLAAAVVAAIVFTEAAVAAALVF